MDPSPVGALYDSLLQSALRQFFDRATLDTEPMAAGAVDGRLAIEPSASPSALIIRWFGTRYTLRVPGRWAFTAYEIRLAQAIGAVLAARYRAIQDPRVIAERVDLFSGAIEDRYVGAFLDRKPYGIDVPPAQADRIAAIIEMLRVAALSSYENRPISTGVLLLGTDVVARSSVQLPSPVMPSKESLARITSFYQLADGVRTLFLANPQGQLLDIVDIERWEREAGHPMPFSIPCARPFQPHARATAYHGHVCAVLSPSREIKIFAEGAEMFAFRGAAWHLVDAQAKYRLWADAVGDEAVASRIFETARDLADAREGALFVVVREPDRAIPQLVASADRLDLPVENGSEGGHGVSRRHLLHLLERRTITDLDPSVLSGLASLDGATVTDRSGHLLAAGAILRHPPSRQLDSGGSVEGARTTAAMAASQYGPVLKVSEDGIITFFDRERVWDI